MEDVTINQGFGLQAKYDDLLLDNFTVKTALSSLADCFDDMLNTYLVKSEHYDKVDGLVQILHRIIKTIQTEDPARLELCKSLTSTMKSDV
ncbi:MAG: hypothetical protein IJT59_01135 [Desulfovibrionaceae bacterium]|nr:hypothetical protein [Desulfovibrionaceae bacterium]